MSNFFLPGSSPLTMKGSMFLVTIQGAALAEHSDGTIQDDGRDFVQDVQFDNVLEAFSDHFGACLSANKYTLGKKINFFAFSIEQGSMVHMHLLIGFTIPTLGSTVSNMFNNKVSATKSNTGFDMGRVNIKIVDYSVGAFLYLIKGMFTPSPKFLAPAEEIKALQADLTPETLGEFFREYRGSMVPTILESGEEGPPSDYTFAEDLLGAYLPLPEKCVQLGVQGLELDEDGEYDLGFHELDWATSHDKVYLQDIRRVGSGNGRKRGGDDLGSANKKAKETEIIEYIMDEMEDEESKSEPDFAKRGLQINLNILKRWSRVYKDKVKAIVDLKTAERAMNLREGLIDNVIPIGARLHRDVFSNGILKTMHNTWFQDIKGNLDAQKLAFWIDVSGDSGMGKTQFLQENLAIPQEKINAGFLSDMTFTGFGHNPSQQVLWMQELESRKLVFNFKEICKAVDLETPLNFRVAYSSDASQGFASVLLSDNILPLPLQIQKYEDQQAATDKESTKHAYQLARRVHKHVIVTKTCNCTFSCKCNTRVHNVLPPLVQDPDNNKLMAPQAWCNTLPAKEMRRMGLDPSTGKIIPPTAVVAGANLQGQMN